MNILIAVESLSTGGAENFAKHLAIGLSSVGHNVNLLLTSPDSIHAKEIHNGVRLIQPLKIPFRQFLKWNYFLFHKTQFWVQAIQFRFVIWRYKIDIVHSHLFITDYKIFRWLNGLNIPWITTMHGCYEWYLFRGSKPDSEPTVNVMYRERMDAIFGRVNFIAMAAQKNSTAFNYVKNKPVARIVNYGIKSPSVSKVAISLVDKREWTIGMVSRGIEEKGWEIGINVFMKFLNETGRQAILKLVYSETSYMKDLKVRCQNINEIEFLGHRDDVINEMYDMDILLFPSYFPSESQPVTIIEALSVGLPVIANSIGEIPKMLVQNGRSAGICVAAGEKMQPDSKKLIEALRHMTESIDLYNSYQINTQLNFQAYSIEACVTEYEGIYAKAINSLI